MFVWIIYIWQQQQQKKKTKEIFKYKPGLQKIQNKK